MPQAPVTILNGFLGAGKATLMQSLLVQARSMPGVRPGVIVNAMSKLDVDGAILDTSEVISHRDPRFAAISAGSISGAQELEQFARAVDKVTAQGDATHILIETSGSTHPWPLLEAIRAHPALRLHGFLSVVDTATLAQDHDLGRAILPAASRHLVAGQRGIENLLAEQIMFCQPHPAERDGPGVRRDAAHCRAGDPSAQPLRRHHGDAMGQCPAGRCAGPAAL